MENGTGFITLALIGLGYFLPWIVAASRHHHNRSSICVINVFLGWTLIGWVIALAMSVSEVHQSAKIGA